MSELTTTAYALLGLLNRHTWSAYELTQFMRVSYLRAIWPRAESRLYEGPKQLVKHGYATATKEKVGKRTRTLYKITANGRKALQKWVQQPARDVVFEHEALLKLAYSDVHDIANLRNIIANISTTTQADVEAAMGGFNMILSELEQNETDKKFALGVLVNAFIFESLQARVRWVEFARSLAEGWDDLHEDATKKQQAIDFYEQRLKNFKQDLQ